ncbi:MAG: molybdenum cofactor biosynthesis protein MoaE [Kineosporiaceae bacterium]
MSGDTSAGTGRVLRAAVGNDPVSAEALAALVASPAAGAVVTFAGTVRDHDTPGRGPVTRLEYEAHPAAADVMTRVCGEIADEHPACRIAVEHRIGRLAVGEVAVAVGVAAAHRREAFAAAEALVERVKTRLPVWKHQVFADGSDEWVGLGEAVPIPG